MSSKRRAEKDRARRKNQRRKPADHVLTHAIRQAVPESAQYVSLCNLEHKIDALLEQKRSELTVTQRGPAASRRTVRVFLSHIATPYPTEAEPRTMKWSFRIEGRILDESNRRDKDRKRMGSFVNRIVIELDPSQYSGKDNLVEWERSPASVDCDGFEITRYSTLPAKATVLIFFDHYPRRFKLTPALANIVRMRSAPEAAINQAIWTYIRANKLQDERERHVIQCDAALRKAFGKETFKVSELAALIRTNLLPMEPIRLEHVIKPESNPMNIGEEAFDVDIDLDLSTGATNTSLLTKDAQEQLQKLDAQIDQYLASISEAKEKREFMLSFAEDPQRFILTWVMSQLQDEKDASAVATLRQASRASETFHQAWVPDAVLQYLSAELEKRKQNRA
eukprot:m.150242 g.150242  ORF g.150242 m.150242 type:complete len:394 (+) comp16168_c1_seq2:334-1515(+)